MKKFYLLCLAALMMAKTNANAITVDDLTGDYTEITTGYDYWNWSSWTYFGYTGSVTISKVDDSTVKINNFYGWASDLTGTVDLENKTITIEPQVLDAEGYYTFCGVNYTSTGYLADKPAVATFDEQAGTITINNWALVYPQTNYGCVDYTVTSLKKADWEANGTYDGGGMIMGAATLTSFKDGTYLLNNFIPNGHFLVFEQGENNTVKATSGSGYEDQYGYDCYWFYYIMPNADGTVQEDDAYFCYGEGSLFDVENRKLQMDFGYYLSMYSSDLTFYGTYTFTWDDVTSVSKVSTDADAKATIIYNLAGVKMGTDSKALPKGIYIANGKKFVVK